MPGTLKKPQNNKEVINQQLHGTIYKKVTKKTHNHESPKKNGDGIIKKCIELFKQGADPKVLIRLEKLLKEQEKYYNYYTKKFLLVLETEVMKLEVEPSVSNNEIEQLQRSPTRRAQILQIISEITKKSSNKDHSEGNATEPFNKQSFSGEVVIVESSDSSAMKRNSLAKGVSGKGTPGTYNTIRSSGRYDASAPPTSEQSQLNAFFSQSDLSIDCKDLKNEKPSTTADAAEVPSGAKTSKLSNDNGSDSGVSLGELSKESLKSPVSSRRSSVSSILSSAGENNDPQKEDTGNQMQPKQAAPEEPKIQENENSGGQANPDQVKEELSQVSLQQVTEARGEESKIPVLRTGMIDDDHTKDPIQPKEKEDRENATPTVQKLPVNEKKGEDIPLKQPNNRNLHVALVAGCALSTIGCIVAGAMTSGLIGAGLLAMAAVFAIAAVAELHSNFLSSKLTSINVSPLVDDKELTAL